MVSNTDGVPELEQGDKPAPDPENVLDTREPQLRPSRLDPSDPPPPEIPVASSEFFDDEIDDPLAPPREPPQGDASFEPSTESTPPTPTPTPTHGGKLDVEATSDDGTETEQTHNSEPAVVADTSTPPPLPSNFASPEPEAISVSVRPQPSEDPMVVVSVSSPLPSVTRDPSPTPHSTVISLPSTSPTRSPSRSTSVSSSPSPTFDMAPVSMTPKTSVSPSFAVSPSPSFSPQESVSVMPSSSGIPSPSPSYTPLPSSMSPGPVSGNVSPSQEVDPSVNPSPSPGSSLANGRPSVTVVPSNHDAEESPLSTPSNSVSIPLSTSSPPEVSISVDNSSKGPDFGDHQGTAEISPQVTVVLPAPPSPAESFAPVASPVSVVPPSLTASPFSDGSATAGSVSPAPSPSGDDIALLPGPEGQFTCVYFGVGLIPEFFSPEPSFFSGTFAQFSVPQGKFPDLAPQYLSHTFGESWSYSVPVDAGVPYEVVLAFAEVYDVACEAGPAFRNFTVSVEDRSISVDIIAEVGCGIVLKKGFDDVVSRTGIIKISLQGIIQNALLSTLCYRPTSNGPSSPTPSTAVLSPTPVVAISPSPLPSPSAVAVSMASPLPSSSTAASLVPSPLPSTSTVATSSPLSTTGTALSPSPTAAEAGTAIVSPGDQYQCVNFGPEAIDGFTLFDPSSISGDFTVYSGPTAVADSPSLPLPYLTHVFGQEWTYFLNVGTTTSQSLVLGFAEVFAGACDAGSGFRTFTVSIAGESRFLDVMESSGCGVVEQVAFDNVNPVSGIIEIAFSSIANQAMLSVLCFTDADTISTSSPVVTPASTMTAIVSTPGSPTPSSSPLVSAILPSIPPSISPVGLPSPSSTPSSVPLVSPSPSADATQLPLDELRTCFKFGEEPVEGFFNVPTPNPDTGVSLFNNPFAVVQGTPFSSVYASHIFGTKFTFSVATGSVAIKSVELGFAEVFEAGCVEGFRVFTIEIGSISRTVDVFSEAGCSTALDIRLDGVVPSASGVIDVVFTAVENFAMVSAICIIENNAGVNVVEGKVSYEGALKDAGGNAIASVTTGQLTESQVPNSSPVESEETSTPSVSPSPSLFPKENGVIIVASTNDTGTGNDTVIVGPGLPFEDIGDPSSGDTPTPTSILVPSNLTSSTEGSEGSPLPLPSPMQINPSASLTPNGDAAVAAATHTPDGVLPSQTLGVTPSLLPSAAPTQTPTISSLPSPPPVAILPGDNGQSSPSDDEEDDWDESGIPSPGAIENEGPTVIPPIPADPSLAPGTTPSTSGETVAVISGSMQPSVSASPSVSFNGEVSLSIPEATPNWSDSPSGTLTPNSESEQPENSVESDSESMLFSPEAAITAVPAVQTSIGGVDASNPDSSGGVSIGIDDQAILGESFTPSPSESLLLGPSPVDDRQPLLPPVDPPLPSPSALPVPSLSPLPEDGPTVTPTPSFSVVAVVVTSEPNVSASAAVSMELVPVTSGSAQLGESPEPSPVPDAPVLSVPGDASSSDGSEGQVESSPSPTQVSSATGANEVIIESTETPSAVPLQSASPPDPAPPKPITSVPENSTDAIGVPEGTVIEDTGENNDLTGDGDGDEGPTIVAGPFMDLIGTKPEGKGFAIGMGVLGGLLVGLLLLCLFFAIFRGRGGSYSYSSQYSAHKPADYDPSEGGYTADLGLGPAPTGDGSMYGGEGQTMYSGGEGTFESRQKTKDESFTYEGAQDGMGGTAGSAYGAEPQDDELRPGSASAYAHMQPDTYNEYTSLNMQGDPDVGKSHGANSAEFTFNDTITMPNPTLYSGNRGDADRLTNPGDDITAASSRLEFRASDSFNAYHSIARPMAHESESSGKQERTMESFAFGGSPWAPPGNGAADGEEYIDDTRDSRAQSVSSTPSAAPSPYEQSIHVPVAHDNTGNVSKGNPKNSRTNLSRSFLAPIARGAMRTSGRVDTEQCHDVSLCDENLATRTEAETAHMEDSFPQRTARSDSASNDGPWPSWWSSSKKSLVPAGTYLEERAPHSHSSHDESAGLGKENETKSNYTGHRSAIETSSQEEEAPGLVTSALRSATPLAPSSKPNVEVDEPSQFAPDSGWLRISKTSCKGYDNGHVRPNGDFDELRKRRQPYVKSVANRLSLGPKSFSTSITGESGLEQARQEYENAKQESNMNLNRGSSSWIAKTPAQT